MFALGDELVFPSVDYATEEGIVAVGGDLSVERLMMAYRSGIFPWYSVGDPIIWWSPDPRMVLFPERLHISKSLRRIVAGGRFDVTVDQCFEQVIRHCARTPRAGEEGTWITPEMMRAYCRLHACGHAHSVEAWRDGVLVGGLYGVLTERCFCGESMFTLASNAGKVAFVHMVAWVREQGCALIDCQMHTPHLARIGAELIPRRRYIALLKASAAMP
ncbi:MAG: leucyl/phenylalanyl-tRNA--protein transferase [Spartobacteria bacterium]|nr:leucyl/phenylalanyl-tRNA--protein transferase [Spartobacteria bacterium]